MKISLSWLSRFLDTSATADEIAKALNSLGIEVEDVVDRSHGLGDFIVGEIVKLEKHPDADKLNICHVDNGKETIVIVTGAQNVRKNLKVAIAPIGSIVPASGIKIERRKLRGVESNGMLCSRAELGLSDDGLDGIMELSDTAKVGSKLTDVLAELKDGVIEVSITPNRSDCLSIYGIARDLSAYGLGKLKPIEFSELELPRSETIGVKVINSESCPLFILRHFTDVTNKESPDWLKDLLLSIGENPISALVDITNYVNHSFGRPMHVYDADKIDGDITVRSANDDEDFIALDQKKYVLTKDDIVIADKNKVLGLAGIIGGYSSKCDLTTKNICLEAAVFDPIKIARTGRRLNINTDARHKFARGVDHDFTLLGAIIATDMIKHMCGGRASDFRIIGSQKSEKIKVKLHLRRIKEIGGISIDEGTIVDILTKLGFSNIESINQDSFELTVPSWRHDITQEEDVVEEILRIYGYDKIPEELLPIDSRASIPTKDIMIEHTRLLLASRGYHELITWSFMSSKIAQKFNLFKEDLLIQNPVNCDLDILRISALPNLLNAVYKNNLRSFENLSFFEIGTIFNSGEVGDQSQVISGIRTGSTSIENVYKDSRKFDFFDAKQAVEEVLKVWNVDSAEVEISRDDLPKYYHPSKSAAFKLGKKIIAYAGEIHPAISQAMKISIHAIGFEVFADQISVKKEKLDNEFISDYQMNLRDFAFVVSEKTEANLIIKSIKSISTDLIRDIHIFDVYKGRELGDDKKSIAIKVSLQAKDKTLTADEISSISDQIIKSVERATGGVLRT